VDSTANCIWHDRDHLLFNYFYNSIVIIRLTEHDVIVGLVLLTWGYSILSHLFTIFFDFFLVYSEEGVINFMVPSKEVGDEVVLAHVHEVFYEFAYFETDLGFNVTCILNCFAIFHQINLLHKTG
jgi:hypothetical protein